MIELLQMLRLPALQMLRLPAPVRRAVYTFTVGSAVIQLAQLLATPCPCQTENLAPAGPPPDPEPDEQAVVDGLDYLHQVNGDRAAGDLQAAAGE